MNQFIALPIGFSQLPKRNHEKLAMSDRSAEEADSSAVDERDWTDVQASVQGDQQAYRRLVERYQQQIAELLWRFCRQTSVHEELVHNTFVEAYFSLQTYKRKAPLLQWLRRIATRVGYKYWKKRQKQDSRDSREVSSPATLHELREPPDESEAAAERLAGLLDQLAPRDRLVLTLMYWEGCSVAEAAKLTGWTESLVKVQVHRARKRLRKLLEEDEA